MMKGRVLVIEDDQDICLGIRTVLSRQGLEVDSSTDGKQGLRAFHLARPEPSTWSCSTSGCRRWTAGPCWSASAT